MADWHEIERKTTGEKQIVASLAGYDMRRWNAVPIDGEPGEHHDVVDGKRVHNAERKARREKEARLNRMSREELVEEISDRFEARLAALPDGLIDLIAERVAAKLKSEELP